MSASHYDVIILGTDSAPLTCGALLAKRGFRVLVLGQGEPPADYQIGPFHLPRRMGHPVSAKSPVTRRVLAELGLSQSFRRMTMAAGPAFQIAMPGHRLDITSDRARLSRELEREFPEVKRPIEDFHTQAQRLSDALDDVLAGDMVWPPTTFLERRALARAHARSGLPRRGEEADNLAEFPEHHAFRRVTQAPAYFETGATRPGTFALGSIRLYDNHVSRHTWLQGGLAAWKSLLMDRIRSHSGQVLLRDRAREIIVRRGRAQGVRVFGSNEEISASFVAAGIGVGPMLGLVPDRSVFEELFERHGEPQVRHYRYLLNVVLPRRAIPEGMGRSLFCVDREGLDAGGEHALCIERQDLDERHCLVTAEALLPAVQVESQSGYLEGARERVTRALSVVLPFVEQHAIVVDSPHDGRDPTVVGDLALRPEALRFRGPRTMPATYSFPGARAFGLCALPTRGPIRNLLLCNNQVVPALGSEGELLSACSTARVIAVADRSKNWMRHRRWSKLEL